MKLCNILERKTASKTPSLTPRKENFAKESVFSRTLKETNGGNVRKNNLIVFADKEEKGKWILII